MLVPDALLDLLRVAVALAAGYAAGSLPVTAWIARRAGVRPAQAGDPVADPEAAEVWAAAGPGAGLLALAAELAKGIVPVAVATVTFGWWTGWVAAAGAVAGACWPALGRRPGTTGVATLAGAELALAPVAGVAALAVSLAALTLGRAAGRAPVRWAVAVGFVAYGLVALLELADASRLVALALLVVPVLLRRRAGPPTRSAPDPA